MWLDVLTSTKFPQRHRTRRSLCTWSRECLVGLTLSAIFPTVIFTYVNLCFTLCFTYFTYVNSCLTLCLTYASMRHIKLTCYLLTFEMLFFSVVTSFGCSDSISGNVRFWLLPFIFFERFGDSNYSDCMKIMSEYKNDSIEWS